MTRIRWKVCILIGVLGGIGAAYAFVFASGKTLSLVQMLCAISGGHMEMRFERIFGFTVQLLPAILISAILGTELYRHFCTAGVYVFTRQPNRVGWYARESLCILLSVLLFQAVYLLACTLTCALRWQITFSVQGLKLVAFHLCVHTLWLYALILLINILAICFGSDYGFLVAMGLAAVQVSLLALLKGDETLDIYPVPVTDTQILIAKCNPMANLITCWHSSADSTLYSQMFYKYTFFSLTHSAVLMFILALAVSIVGGTVVQRTDIISNKETGGFS